MKWKIRIYKQKVIRNARLIGDVLLSGPFLNYRGEFVYEGDITSEYYVESRDSVLGEKYRKHNILENVKKITRFSEEVKSIVERHTFADQDCLYFIRLYFVNPKQGSVYVMDHEYCPWALEIGRFSPRILNGVSGIVHGFKRDEIEMMMKYLGQTK